MITVISPAKSLDFESPLATKKYTQPQYLEHSEALIEELQKLTHQDVASLMKLSDKLAELNVHRFQSFITPFTPDNARQALLAFKGDVYVGLDAESMKAKDFDFAQKHLRILSGLYGLLRPLDLIQPYRLEMGTKFANARGKNLYEFWDTTIHEAINKELTKQDSPELINLASNEYFKAVKHKKLSHTVITPAFKDYKNGQYKMISFFAKKARGMMARFIIDNRINSPDELKDFNTDGYRYDKKSSTPTEPVFLRKQ
ncbi:peroxide stress protein YaaA [Pleionea sediminis]|uniref:peroxide stress protein YaaA n=1 Tax=Pleionea sediminis TaxID=2569479 RepID=UPI0011860C78|nr:peroxide stress protein YaaA [Pleionea sediminis]